MNKLALRQAIKAATLTRGDEARADAALRIAAPEPVKVIRNKLDLRRAIADSPEGKALRFGEMGRIIGLPITERMAPEELEYYNRTHLLASAYDEGFRLFPIQAEGLASYEGVNGCFGPIPVGFGKTLLCLMTANAAFQKGVEKMLYLMPPQVYAQLTEIDLRWARMRVPMTYPIMPLGGLTIERRRNIVQSGKRGLYLMPYSLVSARDGEDMLHAIRPGLIMADEAHSLGRQNAARTKRVMNYVKEYEPEGICLSGTITSKRIRDYYHLIRWCLGPNCPLPLIATQASEWGNVIDSDAGQCSTGDLDPLVRWGQKHFPGEGCDYTKTGFRKAYKLRLNTAPGVAASLNDELGVSLIFHNEPVVEPEKCEGWPRLKELIDGVEEMWETPNGDEIDHAIHTWKWLYELYNGFYNELVWPTPEVYAARKGLVEQEASLILKRAQYHHTLGQEYAKALRDWLKTSHKKGLDTPFLVGQDMARSGADNVGHKLYDVWKQWKDSDFDGRPDRDSHAIRVCPYKINAAADWAESLSGGGLIWCHHQEIGRWCFEVLRDRGLNVLHCPAGPEHNSTIVQPSNADKIVVASITAHGTGKNLQHFSEQYFLQFPRPAVTAEQTIGRTHRNGQKADELVVVTNNTTLFDKMTFAATLNDALYIHQTTGNRQKLIYGTYDQRPMIFPPEVLIEHGMQAKPLTPQQRAMLEERFGDTT